MHPRNIYRVEPDFKELANQFDTFKPFVQVTSQGRSYIDFKDPEAVKTLCQCLLKKDFNLTVDFPLDRLCPAVPNRLNYILWLEDLIKDTLPNKDSIRGIDIGVGASCIYPLLGCSTNPDWTFLGTEINKTSTEYALNNVKANNLEKRITIKYNPDPKKIFLLDKDVEYAFSMCNPPFYSSQEEIDQGLLNKELEPSAVCTGSNDEMITEGGEYAFIKRMIMESLELKQQVRWYTSMIGLKKSIKPLLRVLTDEGISNYIVTSFTQGKTVRWAIGWSFYPERPVKAYAIDTWRPKYQYQVQLDKDSTHVLNVVQEILEDLEINYTQDTNDIDETVLSCSTLRNTWSRAARRQKKRKLEIGEASTLQNNLSEEFVFKLVISVDEPSTFAQIEWIKGGNKTQFEGFWSHLKKRIEENCGISRGSTFSK